VFLRDRPFAEGAAPLGAIERHQSSSVNARFAPIPSWFGTIREIHGYPRPVDGSGKVVGLPGSGVALVERFEERSKVFDLTSSFELVDPTVFEPVTASRFVGLQLDEQTTLPVAFVRSKSAQLYRVRSEGEQPQPYRTLSYRQALPIVVEPVGTSRGSWVRTIDGDYLRRDQVSIVSRSERSPQWAKPGRIWIDVSIESQTLVAYEGTVPKYVTLVSTGVDGLSDPKTSKATKQGVFPIVSKHVTITMDGQDEEHSFEMREVPWVQYFSEGYALHAAYWHDAFGQPKSHGCVNLSPLDARWLFHFTNPGVPLGWHGRTVDDKDAALVYVHS
jgi:lipoprotein-anchoring transpeptidase ErfK/SrfK